MRLFFRFNWISVSQEIQIHSPGVGKKKHKERLEKRKHYGRRNTMFTNLYDP